MSTLTKLRGAGGTSSKSGSSAAHEDPDSLRSQQIARIVDLISEGEIDGIIGGLKGVYLDGTPVQNADGSNNFTGVTIDTRNGTQAQPYIPGFPSVENEVVVSTQVKASASVTRSISNANIDAVRVTIYLPRLTYQDASNGNLVGTSVNIAIDVQNNGGGFVESINDTISGKTTGKYQRAYRIDLPEGGPWDIRVRRITADSTQSNLQNDTWWGSYTEIIDAKLRYPNSAVAAILFDSQQFGSIPTRGYWLKGIKCRVPYNYDPVTREYSGVWDGTFLTKWTDNPAWVFYDLVTTERYGLGAYVDAPLLDKWTLYNIAQNCDQMVPDGFGGMEPRFTCNLYLQTREEAIRVVQNFASVFRGIVFWGSGGLVVAADMPADPTMVFTNANVIDGTFEYSGTDRAARHTVAMVTWNDPANLGKQTIEYVEDVPGIQAYGINETGVVAFGCYSRGQAHRVGRAILNAEINDTETVRFKSGLDGTYVYPGCVFATGDRLRHGQRVGGRVVSATTTAVTTDAPVTLASGTTYTLTCVLPDGTVESRAVTSVAGTTSTLATLAFTTAPQAMAQWVLSAASDQLELWRAVSLSEETPGQLAITGLAYRAAKYMEIESDISFNTMTVGSGLFGTPATPTNVAVSETLYQSGADVKTQVNVSWDGVPGVFWDVMWKNNEGNWLSSGRIFVPSLTVFDIDVGSFEVKVTASTALGLRSNAAVATRIILGKTAPPVAVTGFYVTKVGGLGVAEWNIHADLDVRVGGKIVVRHAQETTGATWSNSVIVAIYDGNTTTGNLALMTGTYMAKARDSSGNWSETVASFVVTEGMANTYSTMWSVVEHPAFTSTGYNVNVEVASNTVRLVSGALTGEYVFGYHDFGSVATRRFEGDVGLLGYYENDALDSRGNIDEWSDVDGGTVNDSDATLYVATSNDGSTWTSFTPFFVADFTCRYVNFKLVLERGSLSTNTACNLLRVDVKVPV